MVCGRDFEAVTWTHLKKHNMTISEYLKLYPNAELQSEAMRKSHPRGKDHPLYGKHHSEETKRKISKSRRGKKLSKEVRKRISIALKGKLAGDKNPAKRPEVREKIRRTIRTLYEKDPTYRERVAEGTKIGMHNPESWSRFIEYIRKRSVDPEWRRKNSESHKGQPNPLKGKTWEEFYGEKRAIEIKEKLSKKMKGKYTGEKNPFYGKHHDRRTRRLMSLAQARRKNHFQSSLETLLYETLKRAGISTKRQFHVDLKATKGRFSTIVDLAIPEKKIAIYCDGCYWHSCPICFDHEVRRGIRGADALVTKRLKALGWQVFRFWEHEIREDIEKCVETIREAL